MKTKALIPTRDAGMRLPPGFKELRKEQEEALEFIGEHWDGIGIDNPAPVIGAGLPTGSGKSLVPWMVKQRGELKGGRVVILTPTKALQDQYMRDFEKVGMVKVEGRGNYECGDYAGETCETGPVLGCRLRDQGVCVHQQVVSGAKRADFTVTNYAYWFRAALQGGTPLSVSEGEMGRPIHLLVLDEAHVAEQELSKALQVHIRERDMKEVGLAGWPDWTRAGKIEVLEWSEWTRGAKEYLEGLVEQGKEDARKGVGLTQNEKEVLRLAGRMVGGMERLAGVMEEDWVGEAIERHWTSSKLNKRGGVEREYRFDCVWPGRYTGLVLGSIPRVLMMSGTLKPRLFRMLGMRRWEVLGDMNKGWTTGYVLREWRSPFSKKRAPVYYWPSTRINHQSGEVDLEKWLEVVEKIVMGRPNTKGLVHTVSYVRQEWLYQHMRPECRERVVRNTNEADSEKALVVAERFWESKEPKVLMSPSFATGWDFKHDRARWQIISKLPYPFTKSPIMKARMDRDDGYPSYLAAIELGQMAGRVVRDKGDWGETFIIDANYSWFEGQNKANLPLGWDVMRIAELPKEPEYD